MVCETFINRKIAILSTRKAMVLHLGLGGGSLNEVVEHK